MKPGLGTGIEEPIDERLQVIFNASRRERVQALERGAAGAEVVEHEPQPGVSRSSAIRA